MEICLRLWNLMFSAFENAREIILKCDNIFLFRMKNLLYVFVIHFLRFLQFQRLYPADPRIIELTVTPSKQRNRKLCVFASYTTTDNVPEYVFFYLKEINKNGFDIVFVTTASAVASSSIKQLSVFCHTIIRRKNLGYDFGSWKAGLFYTGVELENYDLVLLANDSCYAPLFPLKPFLSKGKADICAMTDSHEKSYHLMSYFVLYSRPAFLSKAFRKSWMDVRMLPGKFKGLIVRLYEINMSAAYLKQGLKLAAFFPTALILKRETGSLSQIRRLNPLHVFWKELILTDKCPVLKVDLFKRKFHKAKDDSWKKVIGKTSYPIDLILGHQKKTVTPRDL